MTKNNLKQEAQKKAASPAHLVENSKWSTTFEKYVYDIEGEDIPGPRVLLKLLIGGTTKLVEMPALWIEKDNSVEKA